VRILANEFKLTRNMRKVVQRNADLIGAMHDAEPSTEQYSLFRTYLDSRHRKGGMSDMTVLDYAMMVEDTHVDTKIIEYRRRGPDSFITGKGEGELIAVALTDKMGDGVSMVYSYYNPQHADRSLGTFMILDHIARTRALGLPHVYLGYWVNGSRKMDYKVRFSPQEHLGPKGWERYAAPAH
jgi:arginyl-tRNA--protein-N-Asp/Glu arginylyltransferase